MKKLNFYMHDGDVECDTLYIGVSEEYEFYGDFILRVDDPNTLTDYEESIANAVDPKVEEVLEAELAEIRRIIADPSTPWEPLDEEDEEYIHDCMQMWGIIDG